jgi:class 3 adenylate cyclase
MDKHDEIAQQHLEQFRGRLVKGTGDGVLATFDLPGRAIRCAFALIERLAELDIDVRLGLHTGEIEFRGHDVSGIAVHIAARVSDVAGPGEVLVTRTVRDLVTGSDFAFKDRGAHRLKGVQAEWPLFTVEPGEASGGKQ